MRKIFLAAMTAILVVLALLSACKAGGTYTVGQEFQLAPGQQVSISGQDLTLKFVSVNEDSRCPTGVT